MSRGYFFPRQCGYHFSVQVVQIQGVIFVMFPHRYSVTSQHVKTTMCLTINGSVACRKEVNLLLT